MKDQSDPGNGNQNHQSTKRKKSKLSFGKCHTYFWSQVFSTTACSFLVRYAHKEATQKMGTV
jgi:hypothetical protein